MDNQQTPALSLSDGPESAPEGAPNDGAPLEGGESRAQSAPSADVEAPAAAADSPNAAPPSDYPEPPALDPQAKEFVWDEDVDAAHNYRALGKKLNEVGDMFRTSEYGGGLFLASQNPRVPSGPVHDAGRLAALITDRLRVKCVKGEKVRGSTIPQRHLRTMLASEVFLQQFAPIDRVHQASRYVGDGLQLTMPGYQDYGRGRRILHIGAPPDIEKSPDAINRFLKVMAFATEADRTNAVAAALTVMLRDAWPGNKPLLAVTATKSHSGKDTVISFAAGATPTASISYQKTDWAVERSFVGAVKHNPDVGVVCVENARLEGRDQHIRSGFLERFLTDPRPFLFSTGSGAAVSRHNDVVLAISSNYGLLSEDLLNRGLPIHLAPVGDVAHQPTAIGNPKMEYLPAHRGRIEAELRGMIRRWEEANRPPDTQVRHPFQAWAATVGGILKVCGFKDFLANYSARRTVMDPIRIALGILGSSLPNTWQRARDWAKQIVKLGLAKTLIPLPMQDNEDGRACETGKLLSAHVNVVFHVETDDKRFTVRLEKLRKRWKPGEEPVTQYQFVKENEVAIPEDAS